MTSIFQRPRARPPLASTSSQQNLVDVSNEDELLAALTSLPRSDGACYGRGINIVGNISLTKTIQLNQQHSGIRITSSSNSFVTTKKQIDSCFIIWQNANDVTIENLSTSKNTNSAIFVDIFNNKNATIKSIYVSSASANIVLAKIRIAFRSSIVDCSVDPSFSSLCSIIDSPSGSTSQGFLISHNKGFSGASTMLSGQNGIISSNINIGQITASIQRCVISGNVFSGAINLTTLSSRNCILSNSMNGNNVDLTGSGNNTVVGNSDIGTVILSASGTDAVTSNT